MTTTLIRKSNSGDRSTGSSSKFHRSVKALASFKSATSKRIRFHGHGNEKQTAPSVNSKARQGWIIPANPRRLFHYDDHGWECWVGIISFRVSFYFTTNKRISYKFDGIVGD